ncbi:uncharacterized protein C8A04DRAFT_11294 [Dichotomopilus funicola]|uniref:Uncharacterized protein n=1 Tax=Dichotomopilus funicola TaxID=1934379 RepID=A0AAN6V613_9PEZI|nr:hypothetical protein C8A04DRAFT_11294 [Dichotomopilus funicola]
MDGASAGSDGRPQQPAAAALASKNETSAAATPKPEPKAAAADMTIEYDDFGLPIRKYVAPTGGKTAAADSTAAVATSTAAGSVAGGQIKKPAAAADKKKETTGTAEGTATSGTPGNTKTKAKSDKDQKPKHSVSPSSSNTADVVAAAASNTTPNTQLGDQKQQPANASSGEPSPLRDQAVAEAEKTEPVATEQKQDGSNSKRASAIGMSEFSHQQLTTKQPEQKAEEEDEWQTMPAYAPYDMYDDDNKLIAKEYVEADDDETYGYAGLGGAGKGYTKVLLDDDAESATSMDEHTQYLFKDGGGGTSTGVTDDDDAQRDAVSQLQATKELLTEGQRVAYVGLTRLELSSMLKDAEGLVRGSSRTKKQMSVAAESMKMWSQKMMIRLYSHMEISAAEQVMIEQLSSHGVMPQDLTPVLMANARVRNPMAASATGAAEKDARSSVSSRSTPSRPTSRPASIASPSPGIEHAAEPPPAYVADDDTELTAPVRTPSQLPTTQKIDIDIRWTVLCDLFLVLIADSIYDSRSRQLLERVARDLDITWLDICRFEKKVTDALEMQANSETENWNEDEHMENRRKLALRRRYVMMGLATVGGGLVIGLSAGLLAPVIGMGLAAGFTTIGIGGTGGFLAGAGGAAIITSSAAASGGIIGVRAANRRTGAVKTFEYRPLHNNKRVNLIVTVSGWMTGKVDDVRLPYSTVDPVMGDIYSVLWEPEMLTSMGDTINILATEALTQGLQQVLGSTILISLMAALQVPVVLTKLSYLIDNPWAVSLDRATMAGLILADSLIDRNLGTRPVTLVGYSLGSRVIFSCLQELAKKGAYGLVQNVYLFGSPVVVKTDEYLRARAVVSGRFVNGYNRNDWILGYLFRLTNGGIRRVAGLAAIEDVPGLENMDVSEFVVGHMDYRTAMPRLLRECGWMVEHDEFTEIEDPDPDNYQERQRELITEIEEARRELEKEEKAAAAKGTTGKGGAFGGFFKRKKAPQKQEWELYEEAKAGNKAAAAGTAAGGNASGSGKTEDREGNNHGVLFDVDAIRAEIAKETVNQQQADEELLQVREIKSTLPPIKLALDNNNNTLSPPGKTLRETRSAEIIAQDYQPPPPTAGSGSGYEPTRRSHEPSLSLSRDRNPTFPLTGKSDAGGRSRSSSGYHTFGYGADYQGNGYGHGHHGDDDGVQMTFETGFDDDDHHPTPSSNTAAATKVEDTPESGNGQARPGIRSSQTVPNITLADPWADEEEEFGREKEIKMTFA